MLLELRCAKFRQNPISFHPGLNTVLGDKAATNSIGKSSLLMIIDFVLGGETYIKYNADTVRELGNHEFEFILKFGDNLHYFKRSTENHNYVRVCDSKFEHKDSIHIRKYTDFLKDQYGLQNRSSNFRDIVSRYMRVW